MFGSSSGSRMALNVRFTCSSLLYGYSCMWIVIQMAFPSFRWPNFKTLRNRYVNLNHLTPRLLSDEQDWPWMMAKCRKHIPILLQISRKISVSVYLFCSATIMFVNLNVQKTALEVYGINQSEALSYKATYLAPLVQVSK